MSKFFKYVRKNESGNEVVFINVSQLSLATYNELTGNISVQMDQGQTETIIGEQAGELLSVLNELASN